jgi:hypothetical protein
VGTPGGEDQDGDEGGALASPGGEEGEEDGEEVEVDRWLEKGVGQFRILVPKDTAAPADGPKSVIYPRVVMRVENTLRLILNELLRPETAPAERVSDTSLRLVVVSAPTPSADPKPQSYLIRVKTASDANALLAQINRNIPRSSANFV